jgi:hypothetical protein
MKDAALHLPLLAAYAALALTFILLTSPITAAVMIGSWEVYSREVTQHQIKYDLPFTGGWNSFKWSGEKQFETFFPIAVAQAALAAYNLLA